MLCPRDYARELLPPDGFCTALPSPLARGGDSGAPLESDVFIAACRAFESVPATMSTPELSVVIPVYGCAGCLRALHERLHAALDPAVEDWEVVFVDDSSPDGAWTHLEHLARRDAHVNAVRLSRNFGQHAAITAGLAESRGRWIVVMDCDLQDPPEEIPRMLSTARDEDVEVVLTRRNRRRQPWHRRLAARAYFRLRNALLGTKVDPEHATLSVISRPVVDAFLRMGDRDRQYMLILHWLGFRRAVLQLDPSERHEGHSSYSFSKLVRVALDGMFFQTTALLRWITYLGFLVAASGLALAGSLIVLYFAHRPPPGYTSLAVLILVVGGFIILSTGITGLYVGKIFEQVKGRPLYVIDRRAPVFEGADEPSRPEAVNSP
jgi:glycosyltransferase involved in cell wall biosynthesis